MQFGPEGFNRRVVTGRMNAVGQQDDNNRSIKIHPKRSAGEAEMANAVRGKIAAGA